MYKTIPHNVLAFISLKAVLLWQPDSSVHCKKKYHSVFISDTNITSK